MWKLTSAEPEEEEEEIFHWNFPYSKRKALKKCNEFLGNFPFLNTYKEGRFMTSFPAI